MSILVVEFDTISPTPRVRWGENTAWTTSSHKEQHDIAHQLWDVGLLDTKGNPIRSARYIVLWNPPEEKSRP